MENIKDYVGHERNTKPKPISQTLQEVAETYLENWVYFPTQIKTTVLESHTIICIDLQPCVNKNNEVKY